MIIGSAVVSSEIAVSSLGEWKLEHPALDRIDASSSGGTA
jgi:hypothetical protein